MRKNREEKKTFLPRFKLQARREKTRTVLSKTRTNIKVNVLQSSTHTCDVLRSRGRYIERRVLLCGLCISLSLVIGEQSVGQRTYLLRRTHNLIHKIIPKRYQYLRNCLCILSEIIINQSISSSTIKHDFIDNTLVFDREFI